MSGSGPFPDTTYDLFLRTGTMGFYVTNKNRGVTLTDQRIAWSADGTSDSATFGNIASVNLQAGGISRNAVNICHIRFADRYLLIVTDGNASGTPDDRQTPIYRAFVLDLHARLVTAGPDKISFTSGYSGSRYYMVMVASILLCAMMIPLPLILWLLTGESKAFFLTLAGGWFVWPLIKAMKFMAPRSYDPRHPPGEFLQ